MKGELSNALVIARGASVQVPGSGGEVRLTSFCFRQEYGVPSWATCVVRERVWDPYIRRNVMIERSYRC